MGLLDRDCDEKELEKRDVVLLPVSTIENLLVDPDVICEKKFHETPAAASRTASPLPVRTKLENGLIAAIAEKECVCSRQSTKFAGATATSAPVSSRSHSITMRSGSAYGSGFSNTALQMLKIAVFTPIPSARSGQRRP
jgi:hypothetical protein